MESSAQPQPEPTPRADAQAAARPAPATGGGDAGARGPAEAYTARPEFKTAKKTRWSTILLAGFAAAAAGLATFHVRGAPRVAPPAASAAAPQVLAFSAKDFDAATTRTAAALLAGGKIAPSEKIAGPTPAQQAAYEIAAAPQALRQDISSGRAGFYTFHLAALSDEGGDVYDISVDGAPILRVTTSPQLKSITIPIDATKPHTVTQTLVFARPRTVYAKDGTGGPAPPEPAAQSSLTIQTSEGEAASHLSSTGQSETWTTQFHGGGMGGGR